MTETDFDKQLVAYTDRLAVVAGDSQSFMVSSARGGQCTASLVRLVCGDVRGRGAGFDERPVKSALDGDYAIAHQPLVTGSYGIAEAVPQVAAGTLSFHFYPTLLSDDVDQVLVSHGETRISITGARLTASIGAVRLDASASLRLKRWHTVKLSWSPEATQLSLSIAALGPAEAPATWSANDAGVGIGHALTDCVLAAALDDGLPTACFNGKLEAVELKDAAGTTIAEWHFEVSIASDAFLDAGPGGLDGVFYNNPVRGTRGRFWDATVMDYRQDPSHYGAVHFHDDDLTDARWSPTLAWTVPDDLPSGQYALKLAQGDDVDYVPFFVRPAPHHERARIAYLASTATYLAYANQRMFLAGAFASRVQNENDAFTRDHIEVGLSLYEHHTDGSGVHYSSYLRPVLNLKPRGTMWSFNADTNITAWLEQLDEPFDVITDEDLHREGEALLGHYNVVVSGAHPEYYSVNMLDAIEGFLGRGGRIMYMGGNGFYWKIAYHPDNPAIIEVRRAEGGTRAWEAEAGDYHQSFDGELGGMWRRNGRPPNQLVGVGFAAQGFDGGTYYRLTEAADDPRAAFIMNGVAGEEIIGDYGSVEGGAAGQEIDRWDPDLGSPRHALVIASSENHKPGMLRVVEEMHMTVAQLQGSRVRADMTFFETPSGGAVFSTGSISFAGSLAHNGYDNDICRIATNVVLRFADAAPFDYVTAVSPT